MFSAGDLDVRFAGDGTSVIDLPGGTNEIANATVVQDDGKVVLVGRATVGAETDFFVARLLAGGGIDATFGGGDGVTTIDFAVNDEAMDVALDADGKIVVVGTSSSGAGSNARDFGIARLNTNGSPDTSFSGDGKTTVDFGVNDDAQSVALDQGGLIYIGGYKDLGTTGHFALARLLSNGAQDTSYSTDGEVFFGFGGNNDSRCYDIAIDAVNHVVMVGYDEVIGSGNGRNFACARVGPNALLDPVFSGDGLAVTDFASNDDEARAVGIDPRGNIVVGGFSDGAGGDDFTATRLTRAGALDGSFNGDGAFRMNIGGVEAVDDLVIHPDGDVTLSGQTSVGSFQAALVRLSLGAGTPSASFGDGGDGVQLINFGAIDDGFVVAIDPRDLKVVVAGTDGSGKLAVGRVHDVVDGGFVNTSGGVTRLKAMPDGGFLALSGTLKRVLRDGSIDADFQSPPAGSVTDFAFDGLGRIVTVFTENLGNDDEFVRVKRLLPTGALDTSFGGDGVFDFVYKDALLSGSIARAVAVDATNRIVVAGVEGSIAGSSVVGESAVARVTASGALDPTFDGDGINILNVGSAIDDVTGVLFQPDGRILTLGTTIGEAQVFRVETNGNRDASFGTLGVQRWDLGLGAGEFAEGNGFALDAAGRIVVFGDTLHGNGAELTSDTFVSRLTTAGDLDTSFDGDGSILLRLADGTSEYAERVTIDSAGRIVTVGSVGVGGSFHTIVRRLMPGASVVGDGTFASDGVWVDTQEIVDFPGFSPHRNDVLADGAIYVGGGAAGIRRLNVDPAIVDFEFLFETAPQRLRVRFNDDVGDSITNADLGVRNTTTNVQLNPATYSLASYDPLTNTATLNFSGILADGNYAVTFSSTGISNRQGMNLTGGRVKEFFFLAGDFNHDGRVNLADFNILAGSFGQSNRKFSQGDANYDGVVNLADFNILAGRFGTSLVP